MSKPFYKSIDDLYAVLVEGVNPHEIEPDLYDEDDESLDYIAPDYINRLGTEYGERVIYWESDYNPSAYRLGEHDDDRCNEIFDAIEEYGVEFDIDLVAKYPADYNDKG